MTFLGLCPHSAWSCACLQCLLEFLQEREDKFQWTTRGEFNKGVGRCRQVIRKSAWGFVWHSRMECHPYCPMPQEGRQGTGYWDVKIEIIVWRGMPGRNPDLRWKTDHSEATGWELRGSVSEPYSVLSCQSPTGAPRRLNPIRSHQRSQHRLASQGSESRRIDLERQTKDIHHTHLSPGPDCCISHLHSQLKGFCWKLISLTRSQKNIDYSSQGKNELAFRGSLRWKSFEA